jgi:hypothetical protein
VITVNAIASSFRRDGRHPPPTLAHQAFDRPSRRPRATAPAGRRRDDRDDVTRLGEAPAGACGINAEAPAGTRAAVAHAPSVALAPSVTLVARRRDDNEVNTIVQAMFRAARPACRRADIRLSATPNLRVPDRHRRLGDPIGHRRRLGPARSCSSRRSKRHERGHARSQAGKSLCAPRAAGQCGRRASEPDTSDPEGSVGFGTFEALRETVAWRRV